MVTATHIYHRIFSSSDSAPVEDLVPGEGRSAGVEMVEYIIENMEETEDETDEQKSSVDLPTLPLDPSSLDLPALDSPPTFTPAMKKNIITFAEQYSVNLASKRFKVPINVIKKWLKAENVLVRPKFNSPGQGRKISYSKETDQAIAAHVREQLTRGERISIHYICTYAKAKIQAENPQFNASTGWAQRFLLRHGIDLGTQRPRKRPDTPPKCDSKSSSDARGRPLSYSSATDMAIVEYVRNRQAEGHVITNSELRKYAKELVIKENSNFTGSASWAQNFLLRHKLNLAPLLIRDPSTSPSHMLPHTSLPHTSLPPTSQLMTASSQSPASIAMDTVSSMTDNLLEPAAEIMPTSAPSVLTDPTRITDTTVPTDYSTDSVADDPMKTALAILTSENLESAILTSAQAAALQSTLSELTSDSVSLVDLLSSAQQLQEQGSSEGTIALIHGLESPSGSALYLGLPGTSEAFNAGLLGTQLNPNTQAPNIPIPRTSTIRVEQETGQASRPLSYTKETDLALANWVQEQQAAGRKVTFASLRSYAKKLVSNENPNFNASVGWVTPFLLRHNLDLSVNKKKKQLRKGSTPRKIETPEGGEEEKLLDAIAASEQGESSSSMILGSPSIEEGGVQIVRTEQNPAGVLASGSGEGLELQEGSPNGTPPPSQGQSEGDSQLEPSDASSSEQKPTPSSMKRPKGHRVRHTLAEKLEVVKLMKEYNMAAHYVCRMLGIANSTIAGWIKLVQQKGSELETLSTNKRRSNVSGQGRPLSYSKEKDEAIARWVRSQQEMGMVLSPADLSKYATSMIGEENTNFTASSGWQQKFLQRHSLQLTPKPDKTPLVEDQQNIPAPVQTEEVITHEYSSSVLEKPYSDEVDEQLAKWVREKVTQNTNLNVQDLCQKAEEMVVEQNPMFVATLGWAFKFLHRHNLMLDPKPSVTMVEGFSGARKRSADGIESVYLGTPKKLRSTQLETLSVSPSTGNLCEALLALSNQSQEGGTDPSVQAAVQAAVTSVVAEAIQQQAQQGNTEGQSEVSHTPSNTYFGKPAREFTQEEKEEVVRYANATTLQKAALKYGVAAPTVWRWRVELKLHQPKYTAMQKKYIIKFAETNSLKEASQRYGITGKTIQNWRKALQAEGELPSGPSLLDDSGSIPQEAPGEVVETSGEETNTEVVTYDTQSFQFVVDGGEVVDTREQNGTAPAPAPGSGPRVEPVALEVMNEVDIENVGMEYDVVSSEGHAAKPRCTHQEKVQILQYALEHSIKEASQKFGISPGTLYYWKKNLSGEKTGAGTPSTSLTHPVTSESGSASETVMNVQYAGISGESNVMPPLNHTGNSAVISPEQLLASSTTVESLQTLTQTLANMTPEALQNLPADVNLLQAVSSYLSTIEAEADSQKHKTGMGRRRVSSSGGISSPTEVLVAPFQPPVTASGQITSEMEVDTIPQVVSMEEIPMAESSETAAGSEISVGTEEQYGTAESMEEPPQLSEENSESVGELSVGEITPSQGSTAELKGSTADAIELNPSKE